MAINSQKLLPSSKITSSSIVKAAKVSSSLYKKSGDFKSKVSNIESANGIIVIRRKVIDIANLVSSTNLIKVKSLKEDKKESENKKRDEKENRLEKEVDKNLPKSLTVNLPKLGFLDAINRFITFTLLGWAFKRIYPYLPQILGVIKKLDPVIKFLESFTGNFFKGVVDFIDFGYKAHDTVRDFAKNLGGEPFQKTFDDFSKNLNTFVNLALVAGMLATGGTDFSRKDSKGKKPSDLKSSRSFGQRSILSKGLGRSANRLSLRMLGRAGTRVAKGIFGRIPIIGGLIDFAFSLAMGEKPGRAAAKAVGATVGSALGTLIPIPFAGTILGGILGDIVGGALYDTLTVNKPKKMATGGKVTTRKGKVVGGRVSRTVRKVYTAPIPKQIKPGSSVGGDKKIKELFPEPPKDQTGKMMNSYGFLTNTSKKLASIPFLGSIFNIFGKVLLGDSPTKDDYRIIGSSMNAWINNAISKGALQGNLMSAFADGGIIDIETQMKRDISGWVEKSVEELIKNKVTDAINELRKNLGMEPLSGTEGSTSGGKGEFSPTGIQKDIYEYLLSKGLDDNQALGIMANIHRESGFRVDARQPDGPGVGLFQYSSAGRKDAFLKSVPDWTTNWKGQIDFALKDDVGPQFFQVKFSSPQEAADWWMRKWERPAEYIQNTKGPKIHREYLESVPRNKGGKPNFPSNISLGTERGSLQLAKQIAESMGVPLFSHVRRGDPNSYHYDGRAMDFSNDGVGRGTPEQLKLAKELVKRFGSTAKEIFYTPLGFSIKDGKKVSPVAASGHYDHVHVAFKKGGVIGDQKIKPIQSYASYEDDGSGMQVAILPIIIEKEVPVSTNNSRFNFPGGVNRNGMYSSRVSMT
jgi:hypothetical protein